MKQDRIKTTHGSPVVEVDAGNLYDRFQEGILDVSPDAGDNELEYFMAVLYL